MKKPFEERVFEVLGAPAISPHQRRRCLEIIRKELERRVGARLNAGLSERQIQEFEDLSLGRGNRQWLLHNAPGYEDEETCAMLKAEGFTGSALIRETSTVLWLRTNCPGHENTVSECIEALRGELLAYREVIFGA